MKAAVIRGTRTHPDGSRIVYVVCPVCDRRHWYAANAGVVRCTRKTGNSFSIADPRRNTG